MEKGGFQILNNQIIKCSKTSPWWTRRDFSLAPPEHNPLKRIVRTLLAGFESSRTYKNKKSLSFWRGI